MIDFILHVPGAETLIDWQDLKEALHFCSLAWPHSFSEGWHCPADARPFRPIFDAAGNKVATITQVIRPAGFELARPETVAEQKRRQAAEKADAKRRADFNRIADLAAAPLVGRSVDTTIDMFESNLFNRR